MADPPAPSDSSPGGISVPVTADLGPYRAQLAQGKAEAQQFDAQASAAMANAGRATERLTETQQRMIQTLLKANATAKEAAAVFGQGADGAKLLAAYTQQLTAAQGENAAMAAKQTTAQKALLSSLKEQAETIGMTKAQIAAYRAEQLGVTNEASGFIGKLEEAEGAATKLHVSTSVVTRELLTMGREAARGNWNRFAGSATILAQGLGLTSAALIGITAAAVGTVGAILALEAATVLYDNAQRKLTADLVGSGAASGQSTAAMNAAADAAMRASNQGIQGARASAEAFANAGVRSQEMITVLAASVSTYAALTGEKAAGAQKELAAAMADPIRGAEELHNKIGILNDSQLEQIRILTESGDKQGAVAIITKALADRIVEAQKAGVGLGGTFTNLTKGAAYLWEEIGKVNRELQLFQTYGFGLADAEKKFNAQQAAQVAQIQRQAQLNLDSGAAASVVAQTPEARDEARRQQLAGQAAVLRRGMAADQALGNQSGYSKDAAALADVNRGLQTFIPEAQKAHQIAVLDAQIAATKDKHLKDQLTTQREMLKLSGEVMSPGEAQQRATDAGRIAGSRGGSHAPKDRSQSAMALRDQETAGELSVAAAYLQSDQAALRASASAKTYDDALKEHANAAERARMQQSELNNELAKAAVEAAKEARANMDQTAAEAAANAAVASGKESRAQANELLKEDARIRPLLQAYDVADAKTKAAMKPIIDALTSSYAALNAQQTQGKLIDMKSSDEDATAILKLRLSLVNATKSAQEQAVARAQASQKVTDAGGDPTTGAGLDVVNAAGSRASAQAALEGAQQMRSMTQAVEAETQAFQKQAATLGMTLQAADKYNELQKLLTEAKKDGITVDDQERARLEQLATGYANAAQAARQLALAQKGAMEASTSLSQSFEKSIEGMVFDGKSLSSTAHDLAKSLGKEGLEAVLTGTGPFADLLGTSKSNVVGGANGGVLSQLIGSVFKVPGASPANLTGGMLGGKGPSGTAMDPIYVAPGGAAAITGGKGGNPLSSLMSIFGGGGSAASSAAGATDSLGMFADLLHEGTSHVGTPAPQVRVPANLFAAAPRLHTGLAPDEYPAILQYGEEVKPRGGGRGGRGTTINNHFHGISDVGAFNRSTHQIARKMKRAIA